ncbi:27812_t:CDS:1, partial [Dentiscutata erythropus]
MVFPHDILFEMFNHLYHDYRTLFRCLLVNREWCELAVKILWSNPNLEHLKTIYTLLLNLNEHEREMIGPSDIIPEDAPDLMFDYRSFILTVSSDKLVEGINNWLEHVGKNRINSSSIIIPMLLMFLREGNRLKYLYLDGVQYNRSHKCELK